MTELAEKKAIKDCTVAELLEHFTISNGHEIIITERGCAVKKGSMIIQFLNTDLVKIKKEVN